MKGAEVAEMNKEMFPFVIWMAVGLFIIGDGIWTGFRKKAVRFWGFAKMYEVTDVKKYNRALGILYMLYGAGFIALGIPLRYGRDTPALITSVRNAVFEIVALLLIYALVITPIYKKK